MDGGPHARHILLITERTDWWADHVLPLNGVGFYDADMAKVLTFEATLASSHAALFFQGTDSVLPSAMFSTRLERRRKFNRLAVLVAATLLAVGITLIAIWAVQAFDMLGAAEADRAPIIIGVLIALAALFLLCLIAFAAVRAVGRFTSR
jgi:hypothetical protein